jgi:diguanylate cyclase (GGDEF)-like protein/PAS domain S-box-containing protein
MKFDDVSWMVNLIPDAALMVSREQIIVVANPKAAEMFNTTIKGLEGRPLSELIPYPSKPDHQQHVDRFFRQPETRPMGSGLGFQGQREDGSIFPVDIMISRLEIAGKDYAIGIIRDDSERTAIQAMKDTLELINARLARTQDVGGLGWWELDQRQNQMIWSAMVSQILGVTGAIAPSFTVISDLCVPEDKAQLNAFRAGLRGFADKRVTYRIRRPDGDLRWIEEIVNQEPNQRLLGVMRDVTEQKHLEQRLKVESVTDPLTGLLNRRQFNRVLQARHAKFKRHDSNCALVMYDFDHFKDINDRHGHAMGDEVLKKAAILVKDQLRAYDHAYRLGGEEFAILLSGLKTKDARAFAERIRQSIETAVFELEDTSIRATISVGIAEFRHSDNTFDDALRRADDALYKSKARSRNTITLTE